VTNGETSETRMDIAVVGGGPAGLVAAILLAQSGASVVCFAPEPRHIDHRTSALMQGSVQILKALNVWDELKPKTAALRIMRLIDDTGRLVRAPSVTFDAAEIGDDPYGYNIMNSDLVAVLRKKASETSGLTLIDQAVDEVDAARKQVRLTDENAKQWIVALVVGADGKRSPCRRAAGISVSETALPQTALAFNIDHSAPHELVSTEFHRPNGPLTFVPLPGNRSSVVWVESPEKARTLRALRETAFRDALQERSYGILGDIGAIGPMGSFPLTHARSDALAADRIVLVGEAGHVVPPIGAQGLNLGFRDAAAIAELVRTVRQSDGDPGSREILAKYQNLRERDVATRSNLVNLLNRSVLSELLPFQMVRSAGLYALARSGPLRRLAMRTGIGPLFDSLLASGDREGTDHPVRS